MTIGLTVRIAVWACLLGLGIAPVSAATVAYSKGDRVNVRSRAGYAGEIITQLQRGQQVLVLATNAIVATTPDEPALWYKIALPEGTALWVNAQYVDANTRTVTGDVLNVRSGPSVDHAVVARVARGAVLSRIDEVRDGWLKIGAPEGAVGFVPTIWMTSEAPSTGAPAITTNAPGSSAAKPVAPPRSSTNRTVQGVQAAPREVSPATAPKVVTPPILPVPTSVVATQSVVVPSTVVTNAPPPSPPTSAGPVQGVSPAAAAAGTSASTTTNVSLASAQEVPALPPPSELVSASLSEPGEVEPAPVAARPVWLLPKAVIPKVRPARVAAPTPEDGRWVRREGIVVRPSHIQAPTFAALKSRDRNKTLNFLTSSRADPINWEEYRGKVVVVTGREYLDRRPLWRNIPLLDVEAIEAAR